MSPSRPGNPNESVPQRPMGPLGGATPGRGATPEANIPGVPVYPTIDAPELAAMRAAQEAANAPVVQVEAPTRKYENAGVITAREVISGEADKYSFLDPLILEVTAWVQSALVAANRSDDIEKSRTNKELRAEIAEEIDRLALTYMLEQRRIRGQEGKVVIATVVNDIVGLGPLEPLWQDPTITEVICNGPSEVYVEQRGRLVKAKACRFRSQEHLLEVCQRILAPLNRKVDVKDPLADGRLPDGSRVNVVHHAIAPKGPLLTIRRFPEKNRTMADLVTIGSMDKDMACMVASLVRQRTSMLVVGGTGSGKTTLLNALSVSIPRHERVITIEDSLELRLDPENHVAAMEARPPDANGANAVPIRLLVKNALRMRPERIIVGEIRDAAALDMLQACNTGHEGSMSTIHANGPDEAISRLTVMVAQGGEIPAEKVEWLVGSAIDMILMARRYEDGSRRVSGLYEVPDSNSLQPGESLRTIPLWEWEQTGTDKDGMLIGHYVKKNEVSERLRKDRALDISGVMTWEELCVLCHQEELINWAPGDAVTDAGAPQAGQAVTPAKPKGAPVRPGAGAATAPVADVPNDSPSPAAPARPGRPTVGGNT